MSYRAMFLSDCHLGAAVAKAELLADFLESNRAERYYLVGDFLDFWHPVTVRWTDDCQRVVDHLRRRVEQGAELIYLRGNHDPRPEEALVELGLQVPVQERVLHTIGDGRKLLVVHGDCQDYRLFRSAFMTRVGTILNQGVRFLDCQFGRGLVLLGLRDGELLSRALRRAGWIVCSPSAHERRLVKLAQVTNVDGVICGHFHVAALHENEGFVYANCGDWLHSFAAVAEDLAGNLQLLSPAPSRGSVTEPAQILVQS